MPPKTKSGVPEVRLIGEKSKKKIFLWHWLWWLNSLSPPTRSVNDSTYVAANFQLCYADVKPRWIRLKFPWQLNCWCESEDRRTFSECLRKSGLTWPTPKAARDGRQIVPRLGSCRPPVDQILMNYFSELLKWQKEKAFSLHSWWSHKRRHFQGKNVSKATRNSFSRQLR